jgi:hypothetical protein
LFTDYLTIILLQSYNCTEEFELSKYLRKSLLLLLIIPLIIVLSYFRLLPTPLNELAALSGSVFLIFLVILLIVVVELGYAFIEVTSNSKLYKTYSEPNPLICHRIVKDGHDGAEYLIIGPEEEKFGHACRKQWQFVKTDIHSNWIVKDERGNDITNASLQSSNGIAIVIDIYGSEYLSDIEESDISSVYTSIDEGTKYYD